MKFKRTILSIFLVIWSTCSTLGQSANNDVHIVGQMKNVMWKGQLQGVIAIDTIRNKEHLYGLGPVEYLTGEILVVDGKAYTSSVLTDTSMQVRETYQLKAPFFGYTHIAKWAEQLVPDSVQTLLQIEQYLNKATVASARPLMFKLIGTVDHATIHIVNLPKGSRVSSPEDAHQGQVDYHLMNTSCEIIGFFSTAHKGIFTRHDTFVHMHLITANHKAMGHLDEVQLKRGNMKIYLPTK